MSLTFVETVAANTIGGFVRLLTGVRSTWVASPLAERPRVYYANHSSHADFAVIWASLPPAIRCRVRPVAALDYWQVGKIRPFLARRVFRAVLIQRKGAMRDDNPVDAMAEAIASGASLILFPEGTRTVVETMQPFKSGIYHLAERCPGVDFVPVMAEGLGRVLPKGHFMPLPLFCSLVFGEPIQFGGETKSEFLLRAQQALLDLRRDPEPQATP